MKKSFSLIMLIFWFEQASPQAHDFFINDQTRQYYLHVPDSLPANAPLVFVLHGYSGSAQSIRNYSGMDQIADDSAFAVCYPQGLKDQWNYRFWNVGYDFHDSQTVDDVAFLTALAQYLQNEYNLSSQNTFCTGMSNGGDMCYLLACQAPDVFSAVAPVAGCMMEWIYNSCTPASPIPVFEIHGTDDDITFWNGDPNNEQDYGAYLSVPATFNFWAQLNSCAQYNLEILPNINAADGSYVVSEKYIQGIFNNEVWLYKVIDGGHDWPGSWGNMDIDASAEIWNFFNQVIQKTTNVSKRNENQIPNDVVLFQNYPNPFNLVTTINYTTSQDGFVELCVCNAAGQLVATLVNQRQMPGFHSVAFDASRLASGVYFLQNFHRGVFADKEDNFDQVVDFNLRVKYSFIK